MALAFAAGSTNKVTVANPQTIGAGSEFTWTAWVKFNAAGVAGRGFSKGAIDALVYSNISSSYYLAIGRASSTAICRASAAYSTGVWLFLAGTYSEADGPRLFRGGLGSTVAEETYFSRAVGSGNTSADSGDLFIANRTASSSSSPGCDVATFAWFDRRFTLAELIAHQWESRNQAGCKFFAHLGFGDTATVADWSGNGNNGVITGATVAGHVPIRPAGQRAARYLGALPPRIAAFSVTDADDTVSSTAVLPLAGAGSPGDADDVLAGTSTITIAAALAASDESDSISASAALALDGTAAVTDETDILEATAVIGAAQIDAQLDATDEADSLDASASLSAAATAVIDDEGDQIAASAQIALSGALTAADGDDSASGSTTVAVSASAASNDNDDTLSATAIHQETLATPAERRASGDVVDRSAAGAVTSRAVAGNLQPRSAAG